MFRYKWIADQRERSYGLAVRFFGIDLSVLFLGWLNDWRLIDLRIPCNRGVFLQLGFILLSVGRLNNADIYQNQSS